MKRIAFRILPMIGIAVAAMFSIEAHAAASHVAAFMPSFSAEDISKALAAAGALGLAGTVVADKVEKHASTKWFAIMTEGATIDGRTIERAWLEQMAANYDPSKYGARINLEHFKGIDPKGMFKAYGDVLALKTEEVDGKLKLFAQISPTADLIALTKDRQKIYTSGEVHPSFADSKQAYLVGLAITDTPASLGTEVLSFSARNTQNLYSAALETAFELEEDNAGVADKVKQIFSTVAGLLGKKEKADDAKFTDIGKAVELLANHGKEQAEAFAKLSTDHAALQAAHDKLAQDFAALSDKLAKTPDSQVRPHNTGTTNAVKTDC